MSLVILVCNCHNSETQGRKVLQKAGVPNYTQVPAYKGRQQVRIYLDQNHDDALAEVRALKAYVANHTKFAIIAGFDENRFKWADAINGMEGAVTAESIAQVFA